MQPSLGPVNTPRWPLPVRAPGVWRECCAGLTESGARLGPVNAIDANANGVKTVPIKARDDAQTGCLG